MMYIASGLIWHAWDHAQTDTRTEGKLMNNVQTLHLSTNKIIILYRENHIQTALAKCFLQMINFCKKYLMCYDFNVKCVIATNTSHATPTIPNLMAISSFRICDTSLGTHHATNDVTPSSCTVGRPRCRCVVCRIYLSPQP